MHWCYVHLSAALDKEIGSSSSAQASQGPQRQWVFRSAVIMQKALMHQALSCACIDVMRLGAALKVGTQAVNPMRSMFRHELMIFTKVTSISGSISSWADGGVWAMWTAPCLGASILTLTNWIELTATWWVAVSW